MIYSVSWLAKANQINRRSPILIEKYLVAHCAPVLAGLKTANLFSMPRDLEQSPEQEVFLWNRLLNHKGVYIKVLSCFEKKSLVYVYRKERLLHDWEHSIARQFLGERGYDVSDPVKSIKLLSENLEQVDAFPHEIGFFLGFPPGDILGFITNCGKNYKCCGCWKVYCDEENARKTFNRYKKCKEVYCRCFAEGRPVSKLCIKEYSY